MLKVIWTIIAIVCLLFGYLIYFKKKYSILRGYQLGRFNEQQSKNAGLALLIVGCVWLAISIVLIFFL